MAAAAFVKPEEDDVQARSPSFTPTHREKPLPIASPDNADGFGTANDSPMSIYFSPMPRPAATMEWYASKPLPEPGPPSPSSVNKTSGSPLSNSAAHSPNLKSYGGVAHFVFPPPPGSSYFSSDHSRLSYSTSASSCFLPSSESSTAATSPSPYAFGYAMCSPEKDREEAHNAAVPVGLGLQGQERDEEGGRSEASERAGPFAHHRHPSWTLLNRMRSISVVEAEARLPPSSRPPLSIAVPRRHASRHRTSSSPSTSQSNAHSASSAWAKEGGSTDEPAARPSTARSPSVGSIVSTGSMSVSPRSSSLRRKKTKATRLVTKASEPLLRSTASRKKSEGESSRLDTSFDQAAATRITLFHSADPSDGTTSRTLDDYLDYSYPEVDFSTDSPSLAITLVEEGKGVFLNAEGRSLADLKREAGSKTTHLLLAGCQAAEMDAFLQDVLPLVSTSLLVLDLSDTGLTGLPESLRLCTRLEELNVSANPLTRPWICPGWAALQDSMRVLLVDDCKLCVLPRELGELRNLKTLSIKGNRLSHLPSWLCRLDKMEHLLLDGNDFGGVWKTIYDTFAASCSAQMTSVSSRPPLERNPASAPLFLSALPSTRLPTLSNLSSEELEELDEEAPALPATTTRTSPSRGKEEKMRPLVRRMLSGNLGSETSFSSSAEETASCTPEKQQQRGVTAMASEGEEKKWGTLMRKLGRKASIPQLSFPDHWKSHSEASSPTHSRRGSVNEAAAAAASQTTSLTPIAWREVSADSDLSKGGRNRKRTSFFPIKAETENRRKIRALLQYLQDIDELRTVQGLSMDLSLASRYAHAHPADPASIAMQRTTTTGSGSETSRESIVSTSSSSFSSSGNRLAERPEESKDDAQRRAHIVQEIIATEESYVRGLQELIDIYVVASTALDPSSSQAIVPIGERRQVFGNVDGILQFHQGAFLPALRSAARPLLLDDANDMDSLRRDVETFSGLTASVAEQIAAVFSRHAAFFRMYSSYVNNVDAAQARVSQWKGGNSSSPIEAGTQPHLSGKERKRIKAFLQRARLDGRHSQLSLESYLLLPVQRIPRYRLLLEDLVRNCPSHRLRDPAAVHSALDSICSVATMMNESKRQSEKDRKLLDWQARVQGHLPSPLVQPHRRLIRDGELVLKRVVTKATAVRIPVNKWLPEDVHESCLFDGAVTLSDDAKLLQVQCLDQQCMDKKVVMLLCNDVSAVVVPCSSSTMQVAASSSSLINNSTSPVELFGILRIHGPVQLITPTTLRVVDPKHIMYFSASSPDEAIRWKEAMESVHQVPRVKT